MTRPVIFSSYTSADKDICLAIFDANCPKYFASNERTDYEKFLDLNPAGYELCLSEGDVIGAYGLIGEGSKNRSLNWILLSPRAQGLGLGSILIERAISLAKEAKLTCLNIAASHLSATFFAKFGAVRICELKDGWGPGMHRIDMELRL